MLSLGSYCEVVDTGKFEDTKSSILIGRRYDCLFWYVGE